MPGIFIRGEFGRRLCEDSRNWSEASAGQEIPRTAGSHQKPEEILP